MKFRTKPWVLAAALSAFCVLALAAIFFYRSRGAAWTSRQMAASLPIDNAIILFVDVAAFRASGLMTLIAGTKAVEEAEYKRFVEESGFDYRGDLDRIAISFQGNSRFAVATGQFDWTRIKNYALRSGAECVNGICEIKGREVRVNTMSFYPLSGKAMAVSSLQGSGGVYVIGKDSEAKNAGAVAAWEVDAPVWIRVPDSVWKDTGSLPAGAKIFASTLAGASNSVFSIQPVASSGSLELRLSAQCPNADAAGRIHKDLADATALLVKMLAREGLTPKPGDLAGLLAKGEFKLDGSRVRGTWPLDRALLLSIFDGEVN